MAKKEHICVGGPWDGKFAAIEEGLYGFIVPEPMVSRPGPGILPTDPTLKTTTYTERFLSTPLGSAYFFVPMEMSDAAAIFQMIENYRGVVTNVRKA